MSSSAYLAFDEGAGIGSDDWRVFCERHEITYSPNTVGRNTFYAGAVEITFGEANYGPEPRDEHGRIIWDAVSPPAYAERITFSTFFGGAAMPQVASLALAFWREFGGELQAAPEIRAQAAFGTVDAEPRLR